MKEIYFFKTPIDYVVNSNNLEFSSLTNTKADFTAAPVSFYEAEQANKNYYILTYEKEGELKHDYVEKLWK